MDALQTSRDPSAASEVSGAVRSGAWLEGVELEPAVAPGESSGLVGVGGVFRCIVADPPWKYGAWGKCSVNGLLHGSPANVVTAIPYATMSVDEIAALPVGKLAADDCELYLWTTQKYLPESFRVVEAWGFRYCGVLTWCKAPRGTGQGGLYCPTTEFLVHGRRGKMPEAKRRQDSTWWNITRPNKHSAKPEFFTDVIEAMSDGPRVELFARRQRLGWQTWGNEALCHVSLGGGGAELVTKDSGDTREKPSNG